LGVRPDSYDPLLDVVTVSKLNEIFASLASSTAAVAKSAPAHDSFFAAHTANGGSRAAAP
jgi:hypothetical protein